MKHFRSPQKYFRNINLVDFAPVTEIAHLISGGTLNRFTGFNMYKKKIQFSTLILLAALAVTAVSAADQEEINLPSLGGESENVMQRDQLRNQLMSTEEQSSFRSRIQSASSHQEREEIRIEQRAILMERAKAQGISLPHRSQSSDQSMSQRHGGMGFGGGTGRGRGRF